ncbi:hypothetical protein GCK32_011963 [Trichostrongylus colubriformis]|uniref:Abnormal cell migration protein 18-like fibronectin type I domain-containing protein n=1 Tax=Trichostrongylus colubriformis TaxID=6319 RepID=A0AAN8FBQ0_TRICO
MENENCSFLLQHVFLSNFQRVRYHVIIITFFILIGVTQLKAVCCSNRKMSKMTVKLMQLFLLYLCLEDVLAQKCTFRGKEYSNGVIWEEGYFKMKCTADGDVARVTAIACLTDEGTEVGIGKTVTKGGMKITCKDLGDGNVELYVTAA